MNMLFEILPYLLLVALTVLLVGFYLSTAADKSDAIIPVHVPVANANDFTAQQVFDWVAYITIMTGSREYVQQLAWDDNTKHAELYADLVLLSDAKTQKEVREWLRGVAYDHDLKTNVLDAAY